MLAGMDTLTYGKRMAFVECLADARRGIMPPSETGLHDSTLQALENLAIGYDQQDADHLVAAAARAAFEAEHA